MCAPEPDRPTAEAPDAEQLERLEAEARELLVDTAGELRRLAARLTVLESRLPDPPPEVVELLEPPSVLAEIQGTLELVLGDQVRPAINALEEAAGATVGRLAESWRYHRAMTRMWTEYDALGDRGGSDA